ncbi:VOC family protein [Actinocrinis puniceicyclus]|uniref:VOC family protein n=1 Tax=Actinocrinis puniceicyclus TaxID=977794 RepID=A0A8J8BEZ2_9ACTN|nr:VOC family protein [Actinocrinis puniceicyclus]MBS2964239.1 VOC family protein [Actinocrinis puniceicyclus]
MHIGEAMIKAESGAAGTGPTCVMHSIAVQTAAFEKAYRFYTELVGLRVVREPFPFKTRTLAWLDAGSVLLELYSVRREDNAAAREDGVVGPDHLAFVVDDLDAMILRLHEFEVPIVKGPLIPPSGDPNQPRVLFVEGPDGEEVQFREPAVGARGR